MSFGFHVASAVVTLWLVFALLRARRSAMLSQRLVRAIACSEACVAVGNPGRLLAEAAKVMGFDVQLEQKNRQKIQAARKVFARVDLGAFVRMCFAAKVEVLTFRDLENEKGLIELVLTQKAGSAPGTFSPDALKFVTVLQNPGLELVKLTFREHGVKIQ